MSDDRKQTARNEMMSNVIDRLEYFINFCREHGGYLKNHREFISMQNEIRKIWQRLYSENAQLKEQNAIMRDALETCISDRFMEYRVLAIAERALAACAERSDIANDYC